MARVGDAMLEILDKLTLERSVSAAAAKLDVDLGMAMPKVATWRGDPSPIRSGR